MSPSRFTESDVEDAVLGWNGARQDHCAPQKLDPVLCQNSDSHDIPKRRPTALIGRTDVEIAVGRQDHPVHRAGQEIPRGQVISEPDGNHVAVVDRWFASSKDVQRVRCHPGELVAGASASFDARRAALRKTVMRTPR